MKNVHRDENSPVEMIEGRLKRLRKIDARKRLRLWEEEGGRTGKQRQLGRGKPMNNFKRKHRLKECKCFARVGWILDYRLRFQEEKGRAGGKRKQLRIELKDEEARVDLTRNAPNEKSWGTTTGKPTA